MESALLPIQGLSKARRIAWSAPQSLNSAGYMKMLRERNKTRKVYDVNPYVEVYQFNDNLYGLLNPNCDGGSDVWSWLIVGPRQAMLIGTAFGLGNMKSLIDRITVGKPLIVANSHAGRDQVLGNCRFDKVYCHEYDVDNIRRTGQPGAWDSMFDRNGRNIWMQFDRKDLPTCRNYELVSVKDGHRFNLGGDYDVELVWTGGHTPGHSMFLDKTNRCLFPGDNVSSDTIRSGIGPTPDMPNGQYATLTTYRDCLSRLVTRIGEFDYLFPAHGFVNLENNVLVDTLNTLDQIIARPDVYNYKSEQPGTSGGPDLEVMQKYIRGFATISYTQNGIHPLIK
jgi:glyoxylase-like metal-dependent hydrolase (beta-lactamase superfamily II)